MEKEKKADKNKSSADYYIQEHISDIEKKIKEGASTMTINDSTDMLPLMTDIFNNNTIVELYKSDNDKEFFSAMETQEILKQLDISNEDILNKPLESNIDEYLKILQKLNSVDVSKMTYEQVLDFVRDNNVVFLKYYVATLQPNQMDLLEDSQQTSYAFKSIEYLASIQKSEILSIGFKEFAYLDLNTANIMKYFSNETLTKVQEGIKNYIDNDLDIQDFIDTEYYAIILTNELNKIGNKIKSDVESNKEFYEKRHKKYAKIQKLLKNITKKCQDRVDELAKSKPKRGTGKTDNLFTNDITTNYQMIDNRLHKNLANIENNTEQAIDMKLASGKEKGKVQTPVILNLNIAETNIYGDRLDTWDIFVLDTAFNLYEVGNRHLTPELIYKEMIGKTPNNIGKDIRENIEKSINKLILTRLQLTLSSEIVKRLNIDDETIKKISVIDYALPMKETEIEYANHIIKKGYIYNNEPIYFTFSKLMKQIKTIDRKLLAIDTGSSLTTPRLVIRYYLAREYERIKSTKGGKYENNKISYDTIFDKCDLLKDINKEISETTDEKRLNSLKDKRKKYRQKYIQDIKEVLNQYQKTNIIKSYSEYPADKRVKTGIELVIK